MKKNKKTIDKQILMWYTLSTKEREINTMKINYKEVTITTTCPFCGHTNEVSVNENDYWDWQDGVLIQNAFPYLNADERESLITGICSKCWDDMFSEQFLENALSQALNQMGH